METEYAARRKLLVLLFAVNGRMTATQKAVLIEKAIRNKVESVCEVTDNLAHYFPTDVPNAHDGYAQEIDGAIKTLFKRGSKLATTKGQLEFILGLLERLYRRRNLQDKDDSLENACHYIYRTLNDYLQFSTRDARIWHMHPLGNEWVSDDKLTILYTIMCLPNHEYGDDIKLALMSVALQPEVVNFNSFMVPCSLLVKAADLKNWMFRTQQMVPISEIGTGRTIRCIARQDKLVRMAQYLMSIGTTYRENAEEIIDCLINRIGPTGTELKVWVAEINKLRKNQKKVPAKANLIRLDLVWLLAAALDPQYPTAGMQWLTDVWHHNSSTMDAFLSGRVNRAAVKARLNKVRAQIDECTDPDQRTDENKFKFLISVLNGLFQNETVVTDRLLRLQLIQLRNHLPFYLGLCDNYVAEWNASLPTTVEISVKKELLMPNLVSYPTRRRLAATVLSANEISHVAKAELLATLASNQLNSLDELFAWMQNFKPYDAAQPIRQQLRALYDDVPAPTDDNQKAIVQIVTEVHNLGHMPGMDGNPYLAKFLAIYEGYLGISQRIHDDFHKPNKDNTMKHSIYLHALNALTDPRINSTFPTVQVLGLMQRVCGAAEDELANMEDFLIRYGCSSEFIKPYLARYHNLSVNVPENYRATALHGIALFFKGVQKMPKALIDEKGLIELIDLVQTTLKLTKAECMEWGMVSDSPAETPKEFGFEMPNVMEPTFAQQSPYRDGFDASHETIPYIAPNDNLAQLMVRAFAGDPGRSLRTLLSLREAEITMGLTDEQLAGAFNYLFHHGAVGTLLRIPKCEVEVSVQGHVEHMVYWTALIATQSQAAQTGLSGTRLLHEDQIKTLFTYIDSLEKRQTLARLL